MKYINITGNWSVIDTYYIYINRTKNLPVYLFNVPIKNTLAKTSTFVKNYHNNGFVSQICTKAEKKEKEKQG